MDSNFYEDGRRQNYRYLRQKIIVEEFLSEDGRTPAMDYKIFCFEILAKVRSEVSSSAGSLENLPAYPLSPSRCGYRANSR